MKSELNLFAATLLLASAGSALAAVRYVDVNSASNAPPYTSWATAATNIQDAVDASVSGDEIVVTDGIYAPVGVDQPLTLRSLNGPQFTTIDGGGSNRCVYLTNGASLSGFNLTHGSARYGGGVYGGTLNNCTLMGNSAYGDAPQGGHGGGAADCTLNNCTLIGNWAHGWDLTTDCCGNYGGGAYNCTLNNCTLAGNRARFGSGAYGSTLNNCVVYDSAPGSLGNGNNWFGNPLFVDYAGGNLRLQSNSPCINAGLNALAPAGPDLDGNPRIKGGSVDIGAYEFQSPTSIISYSWLQQYALPTDGSADTADPDGDRMNNWQEWRCATDPTNALSVLRLLTPEPLGPDLAVRWDSVSGRSYFLEWSTNLAPSSQFLLLAANLPGQSGTTTYNHTNAAGARPSFYRVGVP